MASSVQASWGTSEADSEGYSIQWGLSRVILFFKYTNLHYHIALPITNTRGNKYDYQTRIKR